MTAVALVGVVAGMVGLSFASVPFYRMFCQVTGIEGTPRTENVVAPDGVSDRLITVRFDANVNPGLPWQFQPDQRSIQLHLGQEALVYYRVHNQLPEAVTGTATFNVVPEKAARYFNKLECFCFTEQTLTPGQSVEMPVVFFVDPALADDPDTQEIAEVTLSYTFFRVPGTGPSASATGAGGQRGQGVGG